MMGLIPSQFKMPSTGIKRCGVAGVSAMQVMPLEVYATESNLAIIKPPGRKFPGCVVQGDSLSVLCHSAVAIARHAKDGTTSGQDCRYHIELVANSLLRRIVHYQTVLRAHGIEIPYSGEFSEADFVTLSQPDSGNPSGPGA